MCHGWAAFVVLGGGKHSLEINEDLILNNKLIKPHKITLRSQPRHYHISNGNYKKKSHVASPIVNQSEMQKRK